LAIVAGVIGIIGVDPLAEDYYETSPYAYCQNNPVNKIDPDGRGVNDVNPLPEVTVTAKKNDPVGTRAMDPVSGFWGWVGYFAFDRTYRSGENSNGKFPVIKALWNVNSDGIITGAKPTMGMPPDVGIEGGFAALSKLAKLNKLHHVFGKSAHALQDLVLKFGSEEKAFIAVEKVANQALEAGELAPNAKGILPSVGKVLNVDGINVQMIGGKVVNGKVIISSLSRLGL